ncbi:MAG: HAMP domain-containing protein [Chloroflexi bacterium]|nr:MAG: HAMP domain-containing protein [Chloroflexota bacterium]
MVHRGRATHPTLSLRTRLTLIWSAISLLVLIGLELVTIAVLNAQTDGTVDRDLALEVRQYQQVVAGAADPADFRARAQAFLQQDRDSGAGFAAVYLIQFPDGSRLTNTGDVAIQATMANAAATPGQPVTTHDPRAGDLRLVAIPVDQDGRRIADVSIAVPLGGVQSALGAPLGPLLIGNALLVVLGAILAHAVIGRALAPVRDITRTAAVITDGDLSRRIGYRGPRDEVGNLAETFDAMLGRLQSGFQQRQSFYALASHELRTPLTIVRGHLDILRRASRPSPSDIRDTLDIVLQEVDRISVDVGDMLLLGRMLLGQPGPRRPVDAVDVLASVHRKARGLAARDWRVDAEAPVPVLADPEQLGRALLNLVTNALRHTRDGDLVRLTARTTDGWAEIEVADSGQGIAAADLPHVFDPWYRAGRRDGKVGGLGLVIVREVALAHGGRVEVASRVGGGTAFTIRLPLDR